MSSSLPILPTTVIGSYSMPEWLERAKNDYLSRRVSRRDLDEMHDAVRKAAIKDQEAAGVDVVSDGEAQRDNMIDYFTERLPGVQVDLGSKRFYYDFYDTEVRSKLGTGSLGLGDEVRFLKKYTDHPTKISVSGPHTLVKRIRNSADECGWTSYAAFDAIAKAKGIQPPQIWQGTKGGTQTAVRELNMESARCWTS